MLRVSLLALVALLALAGGLLAGIVWSFRTGFAPVQSAIRRLNRRVFNPLQLRSAGEPGAYASVIHHIGRSSGTSYRTPVVAVSGDEGYVIALPYGPGADWVKNVVAAGHATIEHEGATIAVDRPEIAHGPAYGRRFDPKEQASHRRFGVDDYLVLRRAATG